jgi:hypothetical protein
MFRFQIFLLSMLLLTSCSAFKFLREVDVLVEEVSTAKSEDSSKHKESRCLVTNFFRVPEHR